MPLNQLLISPPESDEFAPFFAGYVALMRGRDPVAVLRRQVPVLRRACAGLTDAEALHRYAPAKWSIKQVVGHLSDAERVFSYRLLRICRGDPTPLSGFDEKLYVDTGDFDRRALPSLLDEFDSVRQSTLRLLDGTAPESLLLRGVVNERPISARAVVHIIAGHVDHHFGILRERYGLELPHLEPT